MDQDFNKTMRELYASINENITEAPVNSSEKLVEKKVLKPKTAVKEKGQNLKSESYPAPTTTPKTGENSEVKTPLAPIAYIRRDIEGGILTEETDIEIYKQVQRLDIIQNGLMGDYNTVGEYIVDDEVVLELVKMLKIYDGDVYLKTMFLTSAALFGAGDTPLHFSVEINPAKEQGKLTSVLYLIEDIIQVPNYYKDSPSYLVASYTDIADDKYTDKMFEVFNIKKPDVLINDDATKYQNCINRIKFLSTLKNGLSLTLEIEEEKLLKAKLKAYKELGPYGEKILEEYIALHQKLGNLSYRDKNRLLRSIEERNFDLKNQNSLNSKKIMSVFESIYAKTTLEQVQAAEKNVVLKNGEKAEKVASKAEKARAPAGVDFFLPGLTKDEAKGIFKAKEAGKEKAPEKPKIAVISKNSEPNKTHESDKKKAVVVKINYEQNQKAEQQNENHKPTKPSVFFRETNEKDLDRNK